MHSFVTSSNLSNGICIFYCKEFLIAPSVNASHGQKVVEYLKKLDLRYTRKYACHHL